MAALSLIIAGYGGYRQWKSVTLSKCDMFTVENALAIGETMPNYYTLSDCQAHSGVWNHYSKDVDGGVVSNTKCEVEGEINVGGFIIKGAFRKGSRYSFSWSRYSCETAEGNCCVVQGVIIGG